MWKKGILFTIFGVFIWFIFFKLSLTTSASSFHYFLSAISQGSAAIFAILLSAILIASQISLNYSLRMPESLLGRYFTVIYVLIFASSIILPLIMLTAESISPSLENLLARISLFLVGTYLVLALPFLQSFKNWVKPRNVINDLYTKISQKNLRTLKEPPQEIFAIREISLRLEDLHNLFIFKYGLGKMNDFLKDLLDAQKTGKEGKSDNPELVYSLIRVFRYIRILVKEDPQATKIVLKKLGSQVSILREAYSFNHHLFSEIFGEIKAIFQTIAELEIETVFGDYIHILGEIGKNRAREKQAIITRRMANVLVEATELSEQNNWDQAMSKGIKGIVKVVDQLLDEDWGIESQKQFRRTCRIMISNLQEIHSRSFKQNKIGQADQVSFNINDIWKKTLKKGLTKANNSITYLKSEHVIQIAPIDEKKARETVKSIIKYGAVAVSKNREIAKNCIGLLGRIGFELTEPEERLAKKFIGGIGTIGQEGISHSQQEVVEKAVKTLTALAIHFNKTNNIKFSLLAGANIWTLGNLVFQHSLGFEQGIVRTLNELQNSIGEDFLRQSFELADTWDIPKLSEFRVNFELN